MRAYCLPQNGEKLLKVCTLHEWSALPLDYAPPNTCAVSLVPKEKPYQPLPLSSQYLYVPKKQPVIYQPERLLSYLNFDKNKLLQAMPAFKYDLDGIEMALPPKVFFDRATRMMTLVEGSIALSGDLIIKSNNSISNLTVATSNLKQFSFNAKLACERFLSSLKIAGCNIEGTPSLSIGSSITDKFLMTATSVNADFSGNSATITATYNPPNSMIEMAWLESGLTLEIQMGYQFTGKSSTYPTSPLHPPIMDHTPSKAYITAGAGVIVAGLLILFLPVTAVTVIGAGAVTTLGFAGAY